MLKEFICCRSKLCPKACRNARKSIKKQSSQVLTDEEDPSKPVLSPENNANESGEKKGAGKDGKKDD